MADRMFLFNIYRYLFYALYLTERWFTFSVILFTSRYLFVMSHYDFIPLLLFLARSNQPYPVFMFWSFLFNFIFSPFLSRIWYFLVLHPLSALPINGRIVSSIWACVLPSPLSCRAISAYIVTSTKIYFDISI